MNKWIFVFIGILIAGSIPIAQAKKGKTYQKIEDLMPDPYGPPPPSSSGSGSSGKKNLAPTPTPTQTSKPPGGMVDPYR